MKRWTAILFILSLSACATAPKDVKSETAEKQPAYLSTEAGQPVGAVPAGVLHDARRNKDLNLSIEYPTKPGTYPVIIFSHSYGASNLSYVGLSSYWASRGYVVIKPAHADAGVLEKREEAVSAPAPDQRRGSRDERQRPAAQAPAPPLPPDPATQPAEWRNRVTDISFVIDSFATLEQQYPELKGKMDPARIGVAGYSFGGFTAMLAGGVETFSGNSSVIYSDPRIRAVVVMSPYGPGEQLGLTEQSWAHLRIPALFMTGTSDRGSGETQTPAWRKQAFVLSPDGDKWFVSIHGANHLSFTGMTRISDRESRSPGAYPMPNDPRYPVQPMDPRQQPVSGRSFSGGQSFNLIRNVALAFWDTYLKSNTAGRDYLTKLKDRGDVTVETK